MASRYATGGFESRFLVTRTDGKPCRPDARYIVLDYSGADPHARLALQVYAACVRAENSQMADDLLKALADPAHGPAQHADARVNGAPAQS
jgi:hypothetical protein